MSNPHIDFRTQPKPAIQVGAETDCAPDSGGRQASLLGELLLRTAECLTALLQAPTADAGLNEPRYNVLAILRRKEAAGCSQTELADDLLQSESNLSTLLERMRRDGLISRVRSETDRRKALIELTPAGSEAVARAERARASASAPVWRVLDGESAARLGKTLGLLVRRLEYALGAAPCDGVRPIAAGGFKGPEHDSHPPGHDRPGVPAHSLTAALNPVEPAR